MEKLIRFFQKLFADKFYSAFTIEFKNSKTTHVEMTSARKLAFKDLFIDYIVYNK
jgi:hypothetical protein